MFTAHPLRHHVLENNGSRSVLVQVSILSALWHLPSAKGNQEGGAMEVLSYILNHISTIFSTISQPYLNFSLFIHLNQSLLLYYLFHCYPHFSYQRVSLSPYSQTSVGPWSKTRPQASIVKLIRSLGRRSEQTK
jgi:hypothetical protein